MDAASEGNIFFSRNNTSKYSALQSSLPSAATHQSPLTNTLANEGNPYNNSKYTQQLVPDHTTHYIMKNRSRSPSVGSITRDDSIKSNKREGLQHPRAVFFLLLWYIFSAMTLFLNKYILSYRNFDPHLLCGVQMFTTMVCGGVQMRYPLGCYTPVRGQTRPKNFYAKMAILGILQLGTIMFGLVALYYVAVSFAETVKSSAPLVTVIVAWLLRGERTSLAVFLPLVPVMGGLALCSSGELSYSTPGLLCALTTNCCEVLQSVIAKTLMADPSYTYSPAELQLYPNMFGVAVQLLLWIFFVNPAAVLRPFHEPSLLFSLLLDGFAFHGQTITAYVLMSYVTPVTYSVANTTKRAVLIWLSVAVFGNAVTLSSGAGTVLVLVGVLMYGRATDREQRKREQFSVPAAAVTRFH